MAIYRISITRSVVRVEHFVISSDDEDMAIELAANGHIEPVAVDIVTDECDVLDVEELQ